MEGTSVSSVTLMSMKKISLLCLILAAAAALPLLAEPPQAVRVAVVTDGSPQAESMSRTLEAALSGLEIELIPDARRAAWVIRLSRAEAEALEIGATTGAGIEWVRSFSGELDRVAPGIRRSARAASCRGCGDESNVVSVGLGRTLEDPAAELLTANALRESLKVTAALPDRSASTPATMILPTPGSTLQAPNATFSWDAGTGTSRFWLFVGNWLGGDTLYSADQGVNFTATVPGLPTDGRKVYVRLWSLIDGAWVGRDYEYRASSTIPGGPQKAVMTSPASGSVLPGASATFAWSSGVAVTRYWLFAGLWEGGNTLYSADMGNALTATINGLPTAGQTVYLRLWSYIDGAWQSSDSTYKAFGSTGPPAKAVMSSPASGSALPGTSVTFTWTAGTSVTRYYLMVGTNRGGNTLFNQDMNTALSATVNGLPSDGRRIYARLFSYIDSAWQYNDYEYDAFDPAPGPASKATLTSPAPGSTLTGASATFAWTAGKKVEAYYLFIGDWQGGNTILSRAFEAGTTSAQISGLPTNGRLLFIRLWSYLNGQWEFNDYQVRAATL